MRKEMIDANLATRQMYAHFYAHPKIFHFCNNLAKQFKGDNEIIYFFKKCARQYLKDLDGINLDEVDWNEILISFKEEIEKCSP